MSNKPSYLGLLNAISLGEANAHRYLRAWAEKTTDPDVRRVLETVAIREGEHALAFEKRLCELGFNLRKKPDADSNAKRQMDIVTSDRTDLEKFEALGLGRDEGGADPFGRLFDDTTIDIQTGELLGRYIAEERDSGRLLRACHQTLKERATERTDDEHGPEWSALAGELTELRERIAAFSEDISAVAKATEGLR